jgi:hypothetical protein
VSLSFSFPFFGTDVDSVTIVSAGVVLIGSPMHDDEDEDEMQVPSHIAPFLTSLPREPRDTVEYKDAGKK